LRNISLLPAEVKSYKESAGRINKIAVTFIILILVFVLVYVSLSFVLMAPGRELAQVRRQRAEIGLKVAELKQYGDIDAEISVMEEKLKKAMGDKPWLDEMLSQIFASFPGGARLNELSIDYTGDSEGEEIKMKGLADSHVYVADFLESLKALDSLAGVTCKSSVISGVDGGSAVSFEINAGIVGLNGNKASAGGEGSETPAGEKSNEVPSEGGGER
jgi:Tfp pilus assembly protein PilN